MLAVRTRRALACAAPLALAAFAPASANAQDGELDEDATIIVVGERALALSRESATGSRLGISILETSAGVSMVDREDLGAAMPRSSMR